MAYRRPNEKLSTIQKFIESEKKKGIGPEVSDVLDCIESIIRGRYTLRKVTEQKLIDLNTQKPVERYTRDGYDLQSSIQTSHGPIPTFGRGEGAR